MLSDVAIEIMQQIASDVNKPRRELFLEAPYLVRNANSLRLPFRRRVAEKHSKVALSRGSVGKS